MQIESHTKALLHYSRTRSRPVDASFSALGQGYSTVRPTTTTIPACDESNLRLCFEKVSGAVFPPFRTHPPSHRTRRICDRRGCVTGATGLGDTARTIFIIIATTHVVAGTQDRSCGRMRRQPNCMCSRMRVQLSLVMVKSRAATLASEALVTCIMQ